MLCDTNKCTGCSACYAVCNFNAIVMLEDELGVLHPEIVEDKCKKCGLCEKVCPVIRKNDKLTPQKCYAAYTKNERDVKSVASGGLATAFGRAVLNEGGVVFGTCLGKEARFMCAETEEALENFKGSKYVYVFPDKIYREVKEKLDLGKLCLFVGTPCQVDGLKSFLRKEYENLITVDLICHGTPPFSYLKEHLSKVKEPYEKVSFRGENNFSLTCYNKEGSVIYSMSHHLDEYFYSFLNALTYREACYSCQYARGERVSDITIGDFWGLASDALGGYKGRKSVALINTEKGMSFFEKVNDDIVFEERNVKEAVSGNAQLRAPSKKPSNREVFAETYRHNGFDAAMKKAGVTQKIKMNKFKSRIKMLIKR